MADVDGIFGGLFRRDLGDGLELCDRETVKVGVDWGFYRVCVGGRGSQSFWYSGMVNDLRRVLEGDVIYNLEVTSFAGWKMGKDGSDVLEHIVSEHNAGVRFSNAPYVGEFISCEV